MDTATLVRMANQIAANFASNGEEVAIAATAEHLRLFWDPRMKAAIMTANTEPLNPIAQQAVAKLR